MTQSPLNSSHGTAPTAAPTERKWFFQGDAAGCARGMPRPLAGDSPIQAISLLSKQKQKGGEESVFNLLDWNVLRLRSPFIFHQGVNNENE